MKSKFSVRSLAVGVSLLVGLGHVQSASAKAPLYLWDNQEGILAAKEGCEVVAADKIPFRVSEYYGRKKSETENLRNYHGVRQSHLINHSLVKIIDRMDKRNYTPVEVIGVNERSSAIKNRWFSDRGDQGYLYDRSLRPVEDFVFEVKSEKYGELAQTNSVDLKQNNSIFLRVASGRSYYEVKCPNREDRAYTLFRGYQRHHNDSALFYLGVSNEETRIFKDVRTYGKVESMSFLAEVGNELPIKVDEESLKAAVDATEEVKKDDEVVEELAQEVAEESTLTPSENNQTETSQSEEDRYISADYVVCIGSRTLNVRDQSLDNILFKAEMGESVKIFQSWSGDDNIEKTINGVTYNFKRVQFHERESQDETIGFVADPFIKKRSECRYLNRGATVRDNPADKISGLDDPLCCDFPTADKPTHSYTSGMRRFYSGRGGGSRRHAACDLYRFKNEPIRSVAPGRVLHDLYPFYEGTFALEVLHEGGFVVRYGEMTSKVFVRRGQKVKMGQRIGNMGKVNSGCCRPMLHFELYSGEKRGSLSGGGKFLRRSDLMDPTNYLLKWQDKVF